MRATRSVVLIVLLLCVTAPATSQPAAPRVSAFSPHGTVKGVRQAKAVFSAPMVAFGDLRRPDPFDSHCAEAGTGRWVDTSIWVYDFARDLPAGVRCTFALRAGLTSLDGRAVSGTTQFAFSTGGPAIKTSQPREGDEAIDEDQAFVLELDAPATPASVERHAGFKVDGLPDVIGLRILTGEPREAILKARYGAAAPSGRRARCAGAPAVSEQGPRHAALGQGRRVARAACRPTRIRRSRSRCAAPSR